jgi:prepilin-type N-terminal cleavage/methylation domain-containing protein
MPHHPHARRTGMTLAELLVALIVFSILCAAIGALLIRQERFARGTRDALSRHVRLREGLAVLTRELYPVSPRLGDIAAAGDTLLDLSVTIGGAVACAASGAEILLPAPSIGGNTLAGWSEPPAAGDTLLVLAREAGQSDTAAAWRGTAIVAVGAAAAGCPAPFASAAADRITLSAPQEPAARAGVPVRVVRRYRWRLYRAGDGDWYLGAQDWSVERAAWNTIQPVSGPYRARGRAGTPGGPRLALIGPAGVPIGGAGDPRAALGVAVVLSVDRAPAAGAPARFDSVAAFIAFRNVP